MASRTVSSPNRQASRAASWARGEKRKMRNLDINEVRHATNLVILGEKYNQYATRTKTWTVTELVGGKYETRVRTREVSLSPSKQKRRAARLAKFGTGRS